MNNYTEILNEAVTYMDKGNYRLAVLKLNKLINSGVNNKEVKNYLAVALYSIGNYEEAYNILKNIFKRDEPIDELVFQNIYLAANKINKLCELEIQIKENTSANSKIMLFNFYNKCISQYSSNQNDKLLINYLDKAKICIEDIKKSINRDSNAEKKSSDITGYKNKNLYNVVKITIDLAERELENDSLMSYDEISDTLIELKKAIIKNDIDLVTYLDEKLTDMI